MKSSILSSLFMIMLGATAIAPAHAQDDLVYVAVDPCRIVDTRNAGGDISTNNFRNFQVSGTVGELAVQGGNSDCLDPKATTGQKPLAVSAYVLAVPASGSGSGVLTAYPSDQLPPPVGAGSTVNFAAQQIIGNTTNITLCDPAGCPTDGEFAILSRNTSQHVVIDVQGYFYPMNMQSSSVSEFIGFTTATFDGAQGVATYTGACGVDYAGSHMCTSEEFLNSKTFPATSGNGWIRPTYVPAGSNIRDMSGADAFACGGWSATGVAFDGLYVDFSGRFSLSTCTTVRAVACCL